jgi:hypothetical protein
MFRRLLFRLCVSGAVGAAAVGLLGLTSQSAAAGVVATGSAVVTYNPGTLTSAYAYSSSSWTSGPAIGLPATTEGGYFGDTSIITPFNAQYNPASLVGLSGSGGYIEFQMSQPIATNGYTLAVQAAAGLDDTSYPNGQTGATASDYTFLHQATVLVSQDGSHWVSLGDQNFTIPTNIYTDETDPYGGSAASNLADFSKPFTGTLASFDNENFAQVLATLNGSGGGTWLDLSGTGLSQVDYVAFQTGADETMYVNAITGVTVPEPVSASALVIGIFLVLGRRIRPSKQAASAS